MASSIRHGQERIVVSLDGDVSELTVNPGEVAELILNFPMDGVIVRVEDRDIILECPDGEVIRLVGARSHEGLAYTIEGLDALPSLEAFLARFASGDDAARRDALWDDGDTPDWRYADWEGQPSPFEQTGTGPQSPAVVDSGPGEGRDGAPLQAGSQPDAARGEASGEGAAGVQGNGQTAGPGLNPYQTGHETLEDRAGSLIPSIDRYDDLGTHWWEDASGQTVFPENPPVPGGLSGTPAPPSIELALRDGALYPALHTVMESDPYGMRLELTLSSAPGAPLPLALGVGGTAVMDDGLAALPDYGHWSTWTLELPNGTILPAADFLRETAGGQLVLTLPPGTAGAYLTIPLIDNSVSQADRTFTYTLREAGEYDPRGEITGTVTIVDESRVQDIAPGWTPPYEPGQLPVDYVGPRGPIARVVIDDGASGAHANSILEQDTTPVTYRFELVSQETGAPHTVGEPIAVVLSLTGKNGLVFCDSTATPGANNDFMLDDIVAAFMAGGADSVYYDSAAGELSFTLPAGWSGFIDFNGASKPDSRIEPGLNGSPEALQIAVKSVHGDEAIRGEGAYTEVIDTPVVGVAASHAQFFESPGHASLPNAMTFTFTLSSPAGEDLVLNLDWNTGSSPALTASDITYAITGGTAGANSVNGLPGTITMPKGATSVTVTVTARDDALSEDRETIKVTINSPSGGAAGSYFVGDGTADSGYLGGSASTVLVDDTDVGGGFLDGPIARVVATDASGGILRDTGGNPLSVSDVRENAGTVHYKIALFEADGVTLYNGEREAVTVTFSLEGTGEADIRVNQGSPTGAWDMNFSLPGTVTDNNDGTYTVTIPKNSDGYRFSATVNADTLSESGEGIALKVTKTEGNESAPYGGEFSGYLTGEILDVPVLAITRDPSDHPGYYSENMDDAVLYAITMSTAAPKDMVVRVQLSGQVTLTGTNADVDLSAVVVKDGNGNTLTVTQTTVGGKPVLLIQVPDGAEGPLSLSIPIIDDDLDEDNETITATLLPEIDGAATDLYRVTLDAAKQSATSTIVDDTQPWPGASGTEPPGHGTLSGPTLVLECVKTSGTLANKTEHYVNDRDNRDVEVFEKVESKGKIVYRVSLEDDGGHVANTTQDVVVTIRVDLHGDIAYGDQPITGDFYFDTAAIKAATGNKPVTVSAVQTDAVGPYVELTFTLPAGTSSVEIPVWIVQDQLTETNRWLYDQYGQPVGENGIVLPEGADLIKKPDESFTLTVTKAKGNETRIDANYESVHTRVTEEADGIQVSIDTLNGLDIAVKENQPITFEVTLSQKADEDVIVILKPTAGRDGLSYTNAGPEDFAGSKLTVTIPKGQEKVTHTIYPNNDTLYEYIEKFGLTIDKVIGGEAVPDPSKQTIYGTLQDDMNGPVLNLTADSATVMESTGLHTDNTASFTLELTGANRMPSEDMLVTLRLGQPSGSDPADVKWDAALLDLPPAPAGWQGPWLHVDSVNGNDLVLFVPKGYTGINGDCKIPFKVVVIDDALSEGPETFSVSITGVTGSEATTGKAGDSVTITDDTNRPDITDPNTILDGPFVHITPAPYVNGGEYAYTNADGSVMYVSESGGSAHYYLTLRDENGTIVAAEEDITVTINYRVNWGDTAGVLYDFEELPLTVVIPKGSTSVIFDVEIKDDSLSESNEFFTIGIKGVSGNEARLLPDGHVNRTQVTEIVDDTQSWPDDLHAFTQNTAAGASTSESVSGAGETPDGGALPDNPTHQDGYNGKNLLDGPMMTLSGAERAKEDAIAANYRITLETPPVEEVTAAITMVFDGGLTLADLVSNNPNPSLADIINAFKSVNAGYFAPNGGLTTDRMSITAIDANDLGRGLVITFKVPAGECLADFKVPIGNDTLTETDEGYTLTLTKVSGSEAWISKTAGADTVKTVVVDDGNGPDVIIDAFDPDRNAWDDYSTIDGNKDRLGTTYDDNDKIRFKVSLTNGETASEDITVWVKVSGIAEPVKVTIPSGAGSAEFTVDKKTYTDPADTETKGYPSQVVTTEISAVSGAEASIGSGSYAIAEIYPWTGGDGPWTHITLANVSEDASQQLTNMVKEGDFATFRITLSGSPIYHDQAGNGTLDEALTVSLTFTGRGGGDKRAADPATDFIEGNFAVEFLAANPALAAQGLTVSGISWNAASGVLTLTFPAGTTYAGGITFNMPMAADGKVEGLEGYSIALSGAGSHTGIDRRPIDMLIEDAEQPRIILTTDKTNDVVTENEGLITMRIEMNTELEDEFTVNFAWTSGTGAGQATAGVDFIPPPPSITFHAGTTTWKFDDVKKVWYYEVPITIPNDELSEGDETFTVTITSVTGAEALGGLDAASGGALTVTIKDGVYNGPQVYFDPYSGTSFSEADGTISFEILLDRPAVEDVYVWVRVKDGTGTDGADSDDYDLSKLTGLNGVTYVPHASLPASITGLTDYDAATQEYVRVKIPAGQAQVCMELTDFIVNDQLTEGTENLRLEIVRAEGGEVTIKQGAGKDSLTITIEDDGNGPKVNVIADKTTISEESFSDTTPKGDTVAYTFALESGTAQQPIEITFRVEAVSGTLSRMLAFNSDAALKGVNGGTYYEYTVTIPKNDPSITWVMDTLINDGYVESSQQFRVRITNVYGNESTAGAASSATVTITENDHSPVAGFDNIIMMVGSGGTNAGDVRANLLLNDLDADEARGDALKTAAVTSGTGKYGYYTLDADGNFVYHLNTSNTSISGMKQGEVLEDKFTYQVADHTTSPQSPPDGWNPVTGNGTVQIVTTGDLSQAAFDRCFTGNASQADWIIGSSAADIIDGRGGADLVHAGKGNDTLYVYADGKGRFFGEDGNDTFILKKGASDTISLKDYVGNGSTTNGVIRGGDEAGLDDGTDTLAIDGNGLTLDLAAAWTAGTVTGIEVLDISRKTAGGAANTLVLSKAAVDELTARMSGGAYSILRIDGKEGDRVRFDSGWGEAASQPSGGPAGYILFENSGSQVWVKPDLLIALTGNSVDLTGKAARYEITSADNTGGTIRGGLGDDAIRAGDGNDIIYGGGGKDVIEAGGGNDHIHIGVSGSVTTAIFGTIDGGAGNDTLHLDGANFTLNLSGIQSGIIKDVEIIDIGSGGTGNTLVISGADLGTLCGTGTSLYLTGTGTDSYTLAGADWVFDTAKSDADWTAWTHSNGKTLYAAKAMAQTMGGTDGPDVFNVYTTTDVVDAKGGNDTINVYETGFTRINGGAGVDTMKLMGEGRSFDLDALSAKVTGIEKVNVATTGTAGNTVTLSGTGLAGFDSREGNAPLTLDGTAKDTYILSGTGWNYGGLVGGYQVWTNGSQTLNVNAAMSRKVDGVDDTLSPDSLHVYTANDVVDAKGGDDTIILHARSGNATKTVTGADFGSIDGGNGNDTIQLGGDALTLDLSALGAGKIANVEGFDLTGTATGLVLSENTFTVMGKTALAVTGDALDTLTLQGNWSYSGSNSYMLNGKTVSVDPAMKVTILMGASGTVRAGDTGNTITGSGEADTIYGGAGADVINGGAGNDTLYLGGAGNSLSGGAGSDTFILGSNDAVAQTFSEAGFTRIDGGTGTDTLKLQGDNKALDLTGLTGKLTNIDAIDITGSGDNTLILDSTIFTAGKAGEGITVTGDGGDTLSLLGNWTYDGSGVYTLGSESITVTGGIQVDVAMSTAGAVTAGADGGSVTGSSGNDFITLQTDSFAKIDGGGGFDTLILSLDPAGELDLSTVSLQNLERIEITAGTLTLDIAAIKAITDGSHTGHRLEVDCAQGQLIMTDAADWTQSATTVSINSVDYYSYTNSDAELLLRAEIILVSG